ncbi:choice-of-anchor D domain-containing protein [Salinibacter ruber]|uniref:choice-of-anchor D domain-containing protein n=1 Tax=Salinibacter ruber TaxID=146919 RepID=UPI002074255F|nr:choice-of-anchor D domain-containing protein [Salinibacter ruber]
MSPFDTLKTATAVLSVLLIGAFAMGTSTADAQDETTVTIEGQEADPGQATNVPVEATNLDGVGALRFEIDYDPAVLSFPDGAGTSFEDAETSDIFSGAPSGFEARLSEEGTITIRYTDLAGDPLNFGDGVLFDLTFSAFEGGRSDISFTENSRVTDRNQDNIAVTFGDGFVSEGVGTVSLGTEEGVVLNETARIPLSGEDLSNVGSFTLEVAFDESVADFEGIVNDESGFGIGDESGPNADGLSAEASNGIITIEGVSQDGVTLGQNFAELEFSFLGQDTDLRVRSENSEVSDASLNLLDVTYEDGVLSGDSPALSVPDLGITPGTQIEVPVEASELRDIGSASVAISFNESVLTFDGAQNQIGPPDREFSADTPEPGVVQIEGASASGVDPANNDGKLLDLLFTVEEGILDDGDSVPLTFAEGNEITNNDSPSDLYNTSFEGGDLVVENPAIGFSRTSVEYGFAQTGNTASETVTITNEATDAATLEGDIGLTDGSDAAYSVTSGSGAYSLGPGESQDVTIEYAPSEVSNPDEGVLQITSNDPDNGSQDISLTAQAEAPQIAASIEEPTVRSGESATLTQTVSNEATEAAVLEAQITSTPDFLTLEGASVTSGSGTVGGQSLTLQPGAEAEVQYSFQETVQSTRTFDGTISHETNDPEAASPFNLDVSVTVEAAQIAVSPQELDYGTVQTGTENTETVTIENTNGATLTVSSVEVGAPFSVPDAVASGFEVPGGESRTVDVTYAPTEETADGSPDAGTVSIAHDADNAESPAEVGLQGAAEAPQVAVDPASVDYGVTAINSTASQTVTITNEATETATLEGEVTGLTDGSDAAYSVTSGSGAYSLGPGETQDVTVEYAPTEVSNPDEGTLQITSNDPDNGSQDISLTGQAEPVEVALPAQSLDQREGDTELRVEDVIANAGDAVLITTDNGDGQFGDEEVVGSTTLEEDVDGGEVLVDVGDADPVDHAAHVSTDGTVGGVVATSDRAPVYATAQFEFNDETSVGPAGTVTVDAVEILYEGEVGEDQISIDLHEADREAGTVGAFVGVSQEDLAVNEVHEDVAVDVVEPVSPDEENPERIEDTIEETSDFFAMAHRGPAGTDADGERIPAQRPALATTTGPGTIGDFATVTVEAADLAVNVSRDFEGGASDPTDYELVAIPGSTGVDVAETVTGDRGTNWRAFLETGGSDGSLQSYGDEPFSFRAGRGVWVLAQNGWSFEGTVPAVSAADGTPSVPLQDGWNAISNPLQEDLVWANVRDASGLSEALFRWTGEDRFQRVDTLRSAQENGEAYYTLNNEGADSLELTSGAGPNSTLAANTAAESRSNASPRTVELSATADGKSMTSTVTVGMNPSAEEASSYRAPPAHFGGTALRIRDGDPVKSFVRMVAATDAETSRFDLSLQAEPGTSVEISAGDLPKNAGPGFGVVLVDGGDTHDLRDGPATVTVGENSESAGFQVRLGDAEKIAQQTAPDETRLKANYPNPFSEQTTIEYDVAEQSKVNIRVYNVLGQQVATLARGTKQAGTHQVDWSGQSLSSGKYFVRLEAGGTTDTKQITIVR